MSDFDSQVSYWDAAATTKTFTHPLHRSWLDGVDRGAAVLDYGCGYGRVAVDLARAGFLDVTGVDSSPMMIEQARRRHPDLRFAALVEPPAAPYPDATFDLVLLVAVLTCVPADDTQIRLIAELDRLLKPGGLLYLSDVLLQNDERNLSRYRRDADSHGAYGVFETGDGAVLRHHSRAHLVTLLADFELIDTRTVRVTTMNGHDSTAIQILARKPS